MLRFKPFLGHEGGKERVIFGLYLRGNWPIGFYLSVKCNKHKTYHRPAWLPKSVRSPSYGKL